MTKAPCEICGIEGTPSTLDYGWGGYCCTNNPECRPPMGPRQRDVAWLDVAMLDDLEYVADEAERACRPPEIDHAVLRALIDAARREMAEAARVPGPVPSREECVAWARWHLTHDDDPGDDRGSK